MIETRTDEFLVLFVLYSHIYEEESHLCIRFEAILVPQFFPGAVRLAEVYSGPPSLSVILPFHSPRLLRQDLLRFLYTLFRVS